MFSVLVIILGCHAVTGGLSIAAHLHVFLGNGLRRAAQFDIGPVGIMDLVGWISTATTAAVPPIIVVIIGVVAVAVIIVAIPVIVIAGPNEIIVHVETFSMRKPDASGTRRCL